MSTDQFVEAMFCFSGVDGVSSSTNLGKVDGAEVVRGRPVRSLPAYIGQRNYPGLFWTATTQSLVGYESLLAKAGCTRRRGVELAAWRTLRRVRPDEHAKPGERGSDDHPRHGSKTCPSSARRAQVKGVRCRVQWRRCIDRWRTCELRYWSVGSARTISRLRGSSEGRQLAAGPRVCARMRQRGLRFVPVHSLEVNAER